MDSKKNGRVTIWERTRLCPPYDVITFLKQNSTRVIDQTDHAHFFHVWTCMRSSCRNVQPTGPTHDLLPAARPVLVKMSQAFFGRPRSKSVWSSHNFTLVMANPLKCDGNSYLLKPTVTSDLSIYCRVVESWCFMMTSCPLGLRVLKVNTVHMVHTDQNI